jgi:hypothetical protein
MSNLNLSAAFDFFNMQSQKATKQAAERKARVAQGLPAYQVTQPFAVMDVTGTAVAYISTTNTNDDGEETEKTKFTLSVSQDEYNRILGGTANRGSGPVDNNKFGQFLHITISPKQKKDAALVKELLDLANAHSVVKINIGCSPWTLESTRGKMSGWYASFNHVIDGSSTTA